MKRLYMLLILVLMTAAAWSQPAPDVVILPLEMPGHYDHKASDQLTKTFEEQLHALAPNVHLQLGRGADLTAYQYVTGSEQPPSLDVAKKIARAYEASHVCWISIRFQPDYQADTGNLALAGAARLWVYDAQQSRLVMDQALSLVRVGQVTDINNEQASRAEALQLAQGCVKDLAGKLVSIARQNRAMASQPSSAPDWQVEQAAQASHQAQVTNSRNYRAMVSATKEYQRAAQNQNLADLTISQASMNSAWIALNKDERAAFKEAYPYAVQMLEATPAYYYGGGYWPYRY